MKDQFEPVVRDKILQSIESPVLEFTRREAIVPKVQGKAFAVVGMRRAGKTTFLHQCRSDRLAQKTTREQLVYFNFEDERLAGLAAPDLGLLPETHARLFPSATEGLVTFFLDEIQLVPGWERFARRLLDTPGYELFLSGSSAKLLSREIASAMRGRAWEISIHPFSFPEFLRHHRHELPDDPARLTSRQAARLDHHFADFLERGGFPEAQSLSLPERRQLLQGYVDVLILRDVIERHGVTNVTSLRWMVRRLLGSPASAFSVTKFASELKSQGIPAGRELLYDMLDHLQDAFLLDAIPVATDSERRRHVTPRKVYPVDPALIPVYDRSGRANAGHALEVAVFNELKRRGSETAYVKTPGGFEVDFLARHADGSEELIQVAASVDDPATLERELRALQDASGRYPRAGQVLLTQESRLPFPSVPVPIRILPAWQWMLAGASE